jgi:hypothetical protein
MADDKGGKTPAGKGGRDERLKAALRENLRRRKAQARGRGENAAPERPPREPDTGLKR